MTDKRFIETMPGAVARVASYPIRLPARPAVTKVVEVSKYTRPQREIIDKIMVRESYDSV